MEFDHTSKRFVFDDIDKILLGLRDEITSVPQNQAPEIFSLVRRETVRILGSMAHYSAASDAYKGDLIHLSSLGWITADLQEHALPHDLPYLTAN